MTTRRNFLYSAAATLLLPKIAGAIEPFEHKGSPRLLLGLAAYSFRQYFKGDVQRRNEPEPKDHGIDVFDFIDFCAEQGCAAELTSYYLSKDLTPEVLLKIHRHAFLRGVPISGTAVGNNFAQPKGPGRDKEIASVKDWIDKAALLGAPHIRVFAGAAAKGLSDADARMLCVDALSEVSDYAGQKGIFLGLENHGGIVAEADGLLEIVKAVKSPWFGVNLDTGNFHTDDPYGDLARCAPYAVNVQFKVEMKKRGQKDAEPADYPRVVKILRDANYQGYFTLEYEAKEDPWVAVPAALKKMRETVQA